MIDLPLVVLTQYKIFLTTFAACLKVVCVFERRPTYFASLSAKLTLPPLGIAKMSLTLNEPDRML